MNITIPANGWKPRGYQYNAWETLIKGEIKRLLLVWHRRAGKDDICLHGAARKSLDRKGNYWHMLPEYSQARKAIWDAINPHTGIRRIDEAFPPEIRDPGTSQQEMKIVTKWGSIWQLIGSDNYNSLVGTPPIGVTQSEAALCNPAAWGYLRPILMENNGWAIFISTPRGKNHFWRMYDAFKRDENWFVEKLGVKNTNRFTHEQLQQELKELIAEWGSEEYGRMLYEQEYDCCFDAAIMGAVYGEKFKKLEDEGRILPLPFEENAPVYTGWDLGRTDYTVVWFFQIIGNEVRFIDIYHQHLQDVSHYGEMLQEKGYKYAKHFVPHDAMHKTLSNGGKSVLEQLAEYIPHETIKPLEQYKAQQQHQSTRKMLDYSYFDDEFCGDGIEACKQYRYEWDEKMRMFRDNAVHDWTSHFADALASCALGYQLERPKIEPEKTKYWEDSTVNDLFYNRTKAGRENIRKI